MTDLVARLEQVRGYYIARLSAAYEEARSLGQLLDHEVLTVNDADQVVRDGDPPSGLRMDLLLEVDDRLQPVRVDTVSRPGLATFEMRLGECELEIRDFKWNEAFISATGVPLGKQAVSDWFECWFKEEDEGEEFPKECVHFLSDVRLVDGTFWFEVDLGSVPVSALADLLMSMAQHGATKIVVR